MPRWGLGGDVYLIPEATPAFPVLFLPPQLPPPLGIYCIHWASVLAFPPQILGEGGPGRALAAHSSCAAGLFLVMPSTAPGPGRGRLPCLQPAWGRLFSLLRAEAKLVFLPRSGIAPQKHTMQLLKYLGLAGQLHSGPLVRLRRRPPRGSRAGSVALVAVCWRSGGEGHDGGTLGLWKAPEALGDSPSRTGTDPRPLQSIRLTHLQKGAHLRVSTVERQRLTSPWAGRGRMGL